MKTKNTNKVTSNRDILIVFFGTGLLLLIPLIGMQVSTDWDWNLFDFIIMGILMIGTGLTYVFAARKFSKQRLVIGIVIALAFLLIWAELAVGIFGSPFAGS